MATNKANGDNGDYGNSEDLPKLRKLKQRVTGRAGATVPPLKLKIPKRKRKSADLSLEGSLSDGATDKLDVLEDVDKRDDVVERFSKSIMPKVQGMLAMLEKKLREIFLEEIAALEKQTVPRTEFEHLLKRVDTLELKVVKAEAALETSMRTQRLNDVIVRGIPFRAGLDPRNIARKLFDLVGVETSDLVSAYYLRGRRSDVASTQHKSVGPVSVPLLLKFPSRADAESFRRRAFQQRRNLILKNLDSAFKSDAAIYVHESITTKAAELLANAIKVKQQTKTITAAYTRNGVVVVRFAGDSRPTVVSSVAELHRQEVSRSAVLSDVRESGHKVSENVGRGAEDAEIVAAVVDEAAVADPIIASATTSSVVVDNSGDGINMDCNPVAEEDSLGH